MRKSTSASTGYEKHGLIVPWKNTADGYGAHVFDDKDVYPGFPILYCYTRLEN